MTPAATTPPAYREPGTQHPPALHTEALGRLVTDKLRAQHPEWSISKCIRESKRHSRHDPRRSPTISYADPTGNTATHNILHPGEQS